MAERVCTEHDCSSNEFDTLLSCFLCKGALRDPRCLPCFHSCCKQCLAGYVTEICLSGKPDEGNKFNCPECSTVFYWDDEDGTYNASSSQFIRSMLETASYRVFVKEEPKCCYSCKATTSLRRCKVCDLLHCPQCSEAHENSRTTDERHTCVPIQDYGSRAVSSESSESIHSKQSDERCTLHSKPLHYYCEPCGLFICNDCKTSDHDDGKSHSVKPVEDVNRAKKISLARNISEIKGKLREGESGVQSMTDCLERLKLNLERAKDDVRKHKQHVLETFVQNLEQKEVDIMNHLDQAYNTVYEVLAKQTDGVAKHVEKLKISAELAKSVHKNAGPSDLITLQCEINERVECLAKEKPKPLKPVHYGKIQFHAKQLVDPHFKACFDNFGQVVCDPLISSLHTASEILKDEEDAFVEKMEEWLNDYCKWRLCYRATRDGWSAAKFHECCDKKGPTVCLVKVGSYLFGGYTDQSWEGSSVYKNSTSSFLFSLRNKGNLPPFKAPIFQHYHYAILCHKNYGPCFGYGCDMYIANNANINNQSYTKFGYMYKPPDGYSYHSKKTQQLLAGDFYFQPSEVEVFY